MGTLHVVGQTEDGRLAIGGVYEFFSTYGLPVDIIRIELAARGMVIAWDRFYWEAAQRGVGHRSSMQRIADNTPPRAEDRLHLLRRRYADIPE